MDLLEDLTKIEVSRFGRREALSLAKCTIAMHSRKLSLDDLTEVIRSAIVEPQHFDGFFQGLLGNPQWLKANQKDKMDLLKQIDDRYQERGLGMGTRLETMINLGKLFATKSLDSMRLEALTNTKPYSEENQVLLKMFKSTTIETLVKAMEMFGKPKSTTLHLLNFPLILGFAIPKVENDEDLYKLLDTVEETAKEHGRKFAYRRVFSIEIASRNLQKAEPKLIEWALSDHGPENNFPTIALALMRRTGRFEELIQRAHYEWEIIQYQDLRATFA